MKKVILFLSIWFLIISSCVAATTITTSSVSGHWTLAGSPYLIYNNIQVAASQSLSIDPGVNIIFQGAYKLDVIGILYAVGTFAQPIIFTVNDTSGWSSDTTTSMGGWHGIQILPYIGSSTDSTILRYCNVSYTKFDYASYALSTLFVRRNISIKNCNFSYNRNNPDCASKLINIQGQPCKIDSSIFTNNIVSGGLMLISLTGTTTISNSLISHNLVSVNAVYSQDTILTFQDNELCYNTQTGISSAGMLDIGNCKHVLVSGNKIYENVTANCAAIFLSGGFVDIDKNIICNNQHISGSCGYLDGGGAINIICNGCLTDSTLYTVRNNVIANNYSPFHGGGISVYHTKVIVTNNHIINNKSNLGGGIYLYEYGSDYAIFKNNIFYGNETVPGTSATSPVINGMSNGTIRYENNFTQHSSSFDLGAISGGYTLVGDTTTNIVGPNPWLIAPTMTANVTESAMSANFDLMPISPCIDRGDTTNVAVDSTDYIGNFRINNSIIDIGAFEYLWPLSSYANLSFNDVLHIYPNPTTDVLYIFNVGEKFHYRLLTVTGACLVKGNFYNGSNILSLGTYPIGMYVLEIVGANGDRHVARVVKQ